MTDDPDDETLVSRAREGSEAATAELFSRHWVGAWRVAYGVAGSRAWADDIAQDAFERAIRNLRRFDGRRPFAAWLHRIVVNRALDVMRREKLYAAFEDVHEPPASGGPEDAVLRGQVRAGIAALDIDRRTVVVLHYWLGHPLADVAAMLDVPLGTVHSRLARALEQLRQRLEVEDAERPR